MPTEEKLVVVDVGAMGGLKNSWIGEEEHIFAVLFEADLKESQKLRAEVNKFSETLIINAALGARKEQRTLHLTKSLGCNSVLVPDHDLMLPFSGAPSMHVVGSTVVDIVSYQELYRSNLVPKPDVIKLDVQGFEYEVLLGFGDLLGDCLAIELETHLMPIYKQQKLFHEIYALLRSFGFGARKISPVDHFDGDIVELDVWFTLDASRSEHLNPMGRRKLAMIEKEWGLSARRKQFSADQWDNERSSEQH